MRTLVITMSAALMAGCAAAPSATTKPAAGFLSVSGRGVGGWTMECAYNQGSATAGTLKTRGQTDERNYASKAGVTAATCKYEASSSGPFTLSVGTEDFDCPFTQTEKTKCEKIVRAGEVGEISLKARP